MAFSLKQTRRRIKRGIRHYNVQILPTLLIIFLCVIIGFMGYHILFSVTGFDHLVARAVLGWGMPSVNEETEGFFSFEYVLRSLISILTDYEMGDPRSFLASTFPVLTLAAMEEPWLERTYMFLPDLSFAPEPTRPSPPQDLMDSVEAPTEPRARVGASVPRVLIYHTHSSEMYLGPTAASTGYRNSHLEFSSTNDRAVTGIMQVGRHLAATLSQLGIPVLHDSRIHDYGGLKYSYFNSERTVSEHLQRYPDLELVIDLHRDAGVPEPVTTVNGQRVARVLLVLGTAQDIPQSHPNWQANVAFAQRLFSTAQQMYPGLMRPTQIRRDARYNQHLHPNSLIIEVGSVENTLEEAMLAAEYVARVLANLL